jgi:hypothetical protein
MGSGCRLALPNERPQGLSCSPFGRGLPGYVEVDLVAHAGTSAAGSFVQTVVLTDVATGWTECVPIVVRDGALVIEALGRARASCSRSR